MVRTEAEIPAHVTSKQAGTSQSLLALASLLSGDSHHRGDFHISCLLLTGGQTAPEGRQEGRKVKYAGVPLGEGCQGVICFKQDDQTPSAEQPPALARDIFT